MKQMNKMILFKSIVFVCFSIASCKDSNFCNKNADVMLTSMSPIMDSIVKTQSSPSIVALYSKLIEIENLRRVESQVTLLSGVQFIKDYENDESCSMKMTALEVMGSQDYLLSNNGKTISGFVPLIIISCNGFIKDYKGIIKYIDNTVDTVSNSEVNAILQIDSNKVAKLQNSKSKRIEAYHQKQKQEANAYKEKLRQSEVARIKEEQKIEKEKILEQRRERAALNEADNAIRKSAIRAELLATMYSENELNANNRFRHKNITVRGIVNSVKDPGDGFIDIELLGNEYELISIVCITDDKQKAKLLRRGNEITVRGICKGIDQIGIYVYINEAEILFY